MYTLMAYTILNNIYIYIYIYIMQYTIRLPVT